ncbi:hypothetical protein SEPCBS57363_000072 [Sporothrix epigloea]|uniref:RRM domain-containing protein n=1 Tax=Sporothrix epigloea TaxID=1892477 RepID=A0ABP0D497_9PEZI
MSAPQLLLSRKTGSAMPVATGRTSTATQQAVSAATAMNGSGSAVGDENKLTRAKAAPEGEKVVIRRLPITLTRDEFWKILGDEWKEGNGKVDWFSYHAGKMTKEPSASKPSRPAFATLHVLRREDLNALSEAVRVARWFENKDLSNNQSFLTPPAAEFSLYKKVPSEKRRLDSRQGTIDQDPEFMAFLEALANPTAPMAANTAKDGVSGAENDLLATGGDDDGKSKSKAASTPLIEFLREKKASKIREAIMAKAAKRDAKGKAAMDDLTRRDRVSQDATVTKNVTAVRDAPGARSSRRERDVPSSGRLRSGTVKILTKKAGSTPTTTGPTPSTAANNALAAAAAAREDVPKSRRAGILAAARILQRDLGLSPGNAHRKARAQAAQAAQTVAVQATEAEPKAVASRGGGGRQKKEETAVSKSITSGTASTSAAKSAVSGEILTQMASNAKGNPREERASRGPRSKTGEPSREKGGLATNKVGEVSAPAPTPTKILLKKKDAPAPAPITAPKPAPTTAPKPAPAVNPKPAPIANTKPAQAAISKPTPAAAPKATPAAPPRATPMAAPKAATTTAPKAVPVAAPKAAPAATPAPTNSSGGASKLDQRDKPKTGNSGDGGRNRRPKETATKPQQPAQQVHVGSSGSGSTPNAAATCGVRAFVKHASPSQGITEALLKEAMTKFGAVRLVDMDRRKGFSFVNFAEPASLARAMAASPISIAQTTVQVFERKDQDAKKGGSGSGGGGGGGGEKGRSGGGDQAAPSRKRNVNQPAAAATPAAIASTASAAASPARIVPTTSTAAAPAAASVVLSDRASVAGSATGSNAAGGSGGVGGDSKRGPRRRGGRRRGGGGGEDGDAKEGGSSVRGDGTSGSGGGAGGRGGVRNRRAAAGAS